MQTSNCDRKIPDAFNRANSHSRSSAAPQRAVRPVAGLPKEVALHLPAAGYDRTIDVSKGFHPFDNRCHLQLASPAIAVTIANAFFVFWVLEIADEGAVDLDLVEGEAAQIAERGLRGTKVIKRDATGRSLCSIFFGVDIVAQQ